MGGSSILKIPVWNIESMLIYNMGGLGYGGRGNFGVCT